MDDYQKQTLAAFRHHLTAQGVEHWHIGDEELAHHYALGETPDPPEWQHAWRLILYKLGLRDNWT